MMVASTIVPVVMRTPFACKCRLRAQINARELAEHGGVVERLFRCRVRQVEPLLQEIDPQHLLQCFRPSPVARLGIVRLDQPAQLLPRHHPLHLFQKHRPAGLFRVALESGHHRQRPLPSESGHAGMTFIYACANPITPPVRCANCVSGSNDMHKAATCSRSSAKTMSKGLYAPESCFELWNGQKLHKNATLAS